MRTSNPLMDNRGGKIARSVAAANGWVIRNQLISRDGYDVYLNDDGFELVTRKPGGEENVVVEVDQLDTASPHYAAALSYALENPEILVLQSEEL